jgi:ATP-dependent exoDNAse (exonuclease V) beta subunit
MYFIRNNLIEKFLNHLKALFKGIAYPLIDNKEKYYHSIFYLVVRMLGFNIESEILTIDGRIDCVLKTEKIIYIIEFKTGNTKKAIEQIHEKQYHLAYQTDKRKIELLGIDFDMENKVISDWVLQELD